MLFCFFFLSVLWVFLHCIFKINIYFWFQRKISCMLLLLYLMRMLMDWYQLPLTLIGLMGSAGPAHGQSTSETKAPFTRQCFKWNLVDAVEANVVTVQLQSMCRKAVWCGGAAFLPSARWSAAGISRKSQFCPWICWCSVFVKFQLKSLKKKKKLFSVAPSMIVM